MMMESLFQLIVLIFGTCIGGLVLWKLFDLVRSSINGKTNSITDEDFDRLAKAFMKHSKEMEERVQNLEEIIAADGEKEQHTQIGTPNNRSNLSNDLKQKDRV